MTLCDLVTVFAETKSFTKSRFKKCYELFEKKNPTSSTKFALENNVLIYFFLNLKVNGDSVKENGDLNSNDGNDPMDQDGTTNNDSKKEDENKDKTAVNTNNDNIMKPNETANSTVASENNNSKDSETKQLKIMLSGFVRSEYDELEAMVKELGAEVTSQANFATHLVMPKMGRTISFLCAISYVKFILKPSWIRQSHKEKKLLGKPFFMFYFI